MVTRPPPPPEFLAFEKAVKEAWSERSPAEQESWRAQKVAIGDPSQPPAFDAKAMARIRQRGALSGWVDPIDLLVNLPGSGDASDGHALLNTIATSFDQSRSSAGWRWQMRAGPRAAIFRKVIEGSDEAFHAGFTAAIADASVVPTDVAGERLRAIIADGGAAGLDELATVDDGEKGEDHRADLEAALQALTWARIAAEQGAFDPAPLLAARDAVRRDLSTTIGASDCDRLLGGAFFGYDSQLKRLTAFVTAQYRETRVPVLRVEGIGGAGKSTLLAALVRNGFPRTDPPIVIQIDFDRLLFRNGGELELSFEVARQIGVQVPEADAALRQACEEVAAMRSALGEEGGDEGFAKESLIRTSASFDYQAGEILRRQSVDKRPILLLLDTFEEWRRPGSEPQAPSERLMRLVDWLSGLKDQMGLTDLRAVISGRVTLSGFPQLMLAPTVRLKGIGKRDSKRLLRALGLSSDEADRMLAIIEPGRGRRWIPLTLHLAARMMAQLEPAKRKAFLAGDETIEGNLDEALRQGMLYRRYLEHMRKGDVQKVALPGLALRRVTLPIIRDVLAGPCELGVVDEARARRLFDELEREVWLVQREGDALVHRPDVRSVMIRMLARDPVYTKRVMALHKSAMHWYRGGGGRSELPPDSTRQEALYHELALLPEGADLPHLVHDQVEKGSQPHADLRALLPARDDFDPRLAAQLRFAVDGWVPQDEAHLLPAALQSDYVREQGQRLVRRGDSAEAVRLYQKTGGKEPQWLAQAQVDSVRWPEDLVEDAPYVVRLGELRAELALEVRLKYHVLRAFLRKDKAELARIAGLIDRAAASRLDRPPRSSASTIIDTIYFLLVALGPDALRGLIRSLPRFLVTLAREGRTGRRTFEDWLRAAVVARAFDLDEESAEALRVASPQVVMAGMLRPDPVFLQDYRKELEGLGASSAIDAVDNFDSRLSGSLPDSAELLLAWPAKATEALPETEGTEGNAILRLPRESRLIRAGDAEFRPAIRAALGQAFNDRSEFERLGVLVSEVLPLTPADFTAERIAEGWQRKNQILTRLVEYLDRSNVMEAALAAMCHAAPHASLLDLVREGHQRWYAASQALADRLAAHASLA
jgi:hypothetical protein